MITTEAQVISVSNGVARVETSITSGCGGCQSRSSCGVSGLGKYVAHNRKTVEVHCDTQICAGDALQLSMTEGDLLKAGLLAYLLPSALALVGAGICSAWGDVGAVLGMVAGFGVGFLVAKLSRWTPRLVAKKA